MAPFSRVPAELLEDIEGWDFVAAGRWRWKDHITLGEGRATLQLLKRLFASPAAHGHVTISLEDNQPWGAAAAKGRSPSAPLNFYAGRRPRTV